LERWDEALECYKIAVEYDKRDVWFWFNYGDTLLQLGDHAEAENMLAQALKLNPNHQPTIEKLSMVREKLKEHE
jgi:tetratricopeptide (TPR) repeat protein